MLATLLSRFARPAPPGREYDHLFTSFAPNGASAHLLGALFHKYADAYPDEPPPPQHRHYRAFVLELIHLNGGQRPPVERLNAAYIACFERDDAFQVLLKVWRNDQRFCERLNAVRDAVIADLLANEQAEIERRAYFARWRECVAEPIDLPGETLLEQIRRMSPDDWHEVALNWNWTWDVVELEWITAQRACDRSTAVYVLCSGWPGDIATHKSRPHAAFVRTLASRLEGGFYIKAEFGLALSMRKRAAFEGQLAMAAATGESPWQLPEGLLDHEGTRAHTPKYAVTEGAAHFQYDYWLQHIAPRAR